MTHPKLTPELDVTVAASPQDQTDPAAVRAVPWAVSSGALSSETLAERYELLGLLGSGGMGAVYKAKDVLLGELIALKVLRPDLASNPEMVRRFRQEVKLARRVTHTNVARTYDFGEDGPHKFLTMELVVGVSLAETIHADGPLSVSRVVEIATALAAGLGAAHAAGVVHRDLKPDNVLLADDGRILITDFGIARVADPVQHEAVRTVGAALGTPAYMAPEQVEGARDVDGRADVYALGAILYELFTGAHAWQGETIFMIASRRLIEPPPDPRVRRPDLPSLAADVVLRCMARAKADRFQTMDEVAAALAAISAPSSHLSLSSALPRARPVTGPPPPLATMKSIAVLPFQNAGAPADEYLADGLTDDLIDVLSMTPGLRVCARGVVMARAGSAGDPRRLGEDLGVDAVVLGSLRRSESRLRVTARVLSVGDGFQLWAQRFDRTEGEFFEVNDAVARAVAEALTCKVELPARKPSTDPLALDLYLRARHEYFKWWRDNIIASLALFEQALERAPDDPMILAGYAMALSRRCGQDDSNDGHAEAARGAAERALELAPQSGPARVALAQVLLLSGQSADAAREVQAVLTRHPASADALDLAGRLLVESGPAAAGIQYIERALSLEPNLVTGAMEIAKLHALCGDRAASDAFFGDEPSHPGLSSIYWIHRCRAALWLSDWGRAREWRERFDKREGVHPGITMMLQAMTVDALTPAQLQGVLDVASSGTRLLRRRAFYAQVVCEFASFLGQTELALTALETADRGLVFDTLWLERCAPLDAIRHDPRFVAVATRVQGRAAEVRAALGFP